MTVFIATGGNDSFAGTVVAGDTVDYRSKQGASGIKVDLSQAGAQVTYGSGSDSFISIENVTGTDFRDDITGDAGNNILLGHGGSDLLNAGTGGVDRLEGGDGDDVLTVAYTQAGKANLFGSNGYDTFNITLGAATQSVSASGGDGRDQFNVDAVGAVQLSLGGGRDTVSIGTGQTGVIRISDFQAGNAGDVLELYAFLAALLPDWNQSYSPFGGQVRLVYAEGSTTIQVNPDGAWRDVIVLEGIRGGDLTAYNLGGLSPDGTASEGKSFYSVFSRGTPGNDLIVGSGRTHDFSGGGGDDTLIGGDFEDSLSGGAGDDVLEVGRYGHDTLNGGTGADVFVIRRGYDAYNGAVPNTTRIDDFAVGEDTILVYGASGIASYSQYYETVTLDNGEAIHLPGVAWSQAVIDSFTFVTAPVVVAPVIAPTGTPSASRIIDTTLTVAAGQQLYHVARNAGDPTPPTPHSDATVIMTDSGAKLHVYGTVVSAGGGAAAAVSNDGTTLDGTGVPLIHVHEGGQIQARGLEYARGLYFASRGPNVINDGRITVVSQGAYAAGIETHGFQDLSQGKITNNGTLEVHSKNIAYGITFGNEGYLANNGLISVHGRYAIGVGIERPGSFLNTGTIEAYGTALDGRSAAVTAGNRWGDIQASTFVNDGTLIGDYAFLVYANTFAGDPVPSSEIVENRSNGIVEGDIATASGNDVLDNAGTIRGDIYLEEDNDSLKNTGSIFGEVNLGEGDDSYVGDLGLHDHGRVYAGAGHDSVTAGAGTQYLFGEGGNDTLAGGGGVDWIDGGAGNNRLAGGDDHDILSYRSALVGVTVDLDLGKVTKGSLEDQISGFEEIIGSAFDDVINGLAGAEDLFGEDGADNLAGGAGDDLLVGGRGRDNLTGGLGEDIFVYNIGDGEDVITDFAAGEDVIYLGGLSGWQSLAQVGVDTVMTFAGGDALRLRNVTLSTLTEGNFFYGPDVTPDLSGDPGTARPGNYSVFFWDDYTISAGEVYDLKDQLNGFTAHRGGSLYNAGTIDVVNAGGAIGVTMKTVTSGEQPQSTFVNEATGTLYVSGGTGAFGVYTAMTPMNVDNRGLIKVMAPGATGIYADAAYTVIDNSGRIEVRGNVATGIQSYAADHVTNSGTLIVEGESAASGIELDAYGSSQYLVNTGVIWVNKLPTVEGAAFGSNGVYFGASGTFDNRGTVTATTAVIAGESQFTLTNSGTLNGDVQLGYYAYLYNNEFVSQVTNTGAINGDVRGGKGRDLVDAASGTIRGAIYGMAGDDYLYAGAKGQVFDGGDGFDAVDFSRAVAGVTVAINGASTVAGVSHRFKNVETLIGSRFNDVLSGSQRGDTLAGGEGHDLLTGGTGGDAFLYGLGDGNDTITDFMVNGPQYDVIDVSAAGITAWQQLVQVGADTRVEFRTDAAIVLRGVQAATVTAANFRFAIEPGNLSLNGTAGNDILAGRDGHDLIDGQGGNDILSDGKGNDNLLGGAGDDYIFIRAGNNTIDGGDGIDTIDFSQASGWVAFGPESAFRPLTEGYEIDTLVSIEHFVGSYFGDGISGTTGDNSLWGSEGNDNLTGERGNDYLEGGLGSDTYSFGLGHGQDVINNLHAGDEASALDTLFFHENIKVSDVSMSRDAFGNLVFTIGALGDSVTVRDYFNGAQYQGLQVTFAREGTWTAARLDMWPTEGDDNFTLVAANDVMSGLGGHDTINGEGGKDRLAGDGGNDVLTGGLGEDTLNGGLGNDLLDGSDIDFDQLSGGLGDDTYIVGPQADNVIEDANAGTDLVFSARDCLIGLYVEHLILTGSANVSGTGGDNANSITGNTGNNQLDGGLGADTLSGGLGNDTFIVDQAGDVVIEGSNSGIDEVWSYVSYALTAEGVEKLTLAGFDNLSGIGNAIANRLTGNAGHNLLDGGAGNDTMLGGMGDDTFIVNADGDVVTELAGEGRDTVQSARTFTLGAHVDNLVLTGAAVINGTGNDLGNILTGNATSNILTGGLGDDTYYIQNTSDNVVEQHLQGTDVIYSTVTYSLSGRAVENLVLQGAANLTGTGNGLNNALTGNAGNNSLDGGAGADVLKGGLGNDTYYVDHAQDNVVEAHLEGSDTVISSVTYSLFGRAVENLTVTGAGHLAATGNGLNNALTGNAGNNLLDGGAGNDSLAGGLGNDTYVVDVVGDVVNEGVNAGIDLVQSGVTWTLGGNVENLVLTGAGVANGTGNALDNLLTGNAAANILAGGLGNDTYVLQNTSDQAVELAGEGIDTIETNLTRILSANVENLVLTGTSAINGTGNVLGNRLTGNSTTNVLTGGAGNDTYVVQNTSDSVVELSGEGTDFVVASVSWTLGANLENITLTGTANLSATGNDLNNVLTGNAGNNILTGGLGDDIYYIQNAGDSVVEQHLQGTDTIVSGFTYSLFGRAVEILQLTGTDHINATGNSLNNSLLGNSGNNILDGGTGSDNLRGNAGADTFVFLAGSGKDTVRDFTTAQNDMIDIHAYTAGVANAGLISQSGAHVLITLGGGNVVTVENATTADVLSHMVW